jgi:acetylornithine deacetylase/succinyl-diaminopimelate desuccinylase-like protein
MTEETVKTRIERMLAAMKKKDPDLNTVVEIGSQINPAPSLNVPPLDVPLDENVVQAIKRSHSRVVGVEPKVGATEGLRFGGSDANHLFCAGIPSVDYGTGDIELLGKSD